MSTHAARVATATAIATAVTGALTQIENPAARACLGLASLLVFWVVGWMSPSPRTPKEPEL